MTLLEDFIYTELAYCIDIGREGLGSYRTREVHPTASLYTRGTVRSDRLETRIKTVFQNADI
jgi:hypothetical protein